MKQACPIIVTVAFVVVAVLPPPGARGGVTEIPPDKPGERRPSSVWVEPAFKQRPERRIGRLQVFLSKPEGEVQTCPAAVFFPIRMLTKNPDGSAKSIPLKIFLTAEAPKAATDAAKANDEKAGEKQISDPSSSVMLTVHMEEASPAELDAFLSTLPAERREKVATPLTFVSPALSFNIKRPAETGCLQLVVDPRPPTAARR